MKFIAVVAALALVAVAQDTPTNIPECADKCVTGATTGDKIAGCNQGDVRCICANEDFLDSIACCLEDACDEAAKDQAVNFAKALCSGAGVQVPDEVVCRSNAGGDSPSASGSGTPSGSATGAQESAAPTETPSSGNAAGPMAGGLLGGALAALALL